MRRRCAASRRDILRASKMHRWVTGDLRTEPEAHPAVMASLVRHRAQHVALGVIA
jgi:hypothetical protein